MDFRNFCSKIDVDAIRAKFPPLPDMVTQLKLPKSMSKLKSRKIFRSSRDDVSGGISRSASKRAASADIAQAPKPMDSPFALPSSEFVNHTPQRISTISSLVDQRGGGRGVGRGRSAGAGDTSKRRSHLEDQDEESFYRSAGGIDDYCPSPQQEATKRRFSTLSPEHRYDSQQNVQMSFKEKVQKGYKDVSDFRLKHIFAKKTVVRQDGITVDHYVQGFKEDRRRQQREEEKQDRVIADNYDFKFKLSRRKSEESFGVSTPRGSPGNQHHTTGGHKKPLSEQSGDESGMEQSPPKRKPGIASTRFAKERSVPLRMSLEEQEEKAKREHTDLELSDDDDDDAAHQEPDDDIEMEEIEAVAPKRRPNKSALYNQVHRQQEMEQESQPQLHKSKSIKKRLAHIHKSDEERESTTTGGSVKKRQAPTSPELSEDEIDCATPPPRAPAGASNDKQTEKPAFGAIKQNLKRFQKSIKLPSSTSSVAPSRAESDNDEANAEEVKNKQSKTQQIVERLKRFRSVDNVDKHTREDEEEPEGNKTAGSPLHKLQNILQEWKKVLKKKPSDAYDDEVTKSPEKRDKPGGTFIRKLQHIRARKQHSTTDDPDEDEEGGETYKGSFKSRAKLQLEKGVAAASQMPQITMEKLKESKKYFRKKQDKDKDKENDKEKDTESNKKTNDKQGSDESDLDLDEEVAEVPKPVHKKKTKHVAGDNKGKNKRHYYSSDDEEDNDDDEDEFAEDLEPATKVTLEPYQQNVLVPLSRTAWSTKPITSDSTGDDDDDDMLPRVLIHQDNSDIFESTLIIAVTRPIVPRSHTTSPYITEITNDSPMGSPTDSPKQSTPETKADSWVPNREIISNFQEIGSPMSSSSHRQQSKDSIPSSSGSRGHSRKHSMDSSSEDSWIKDVPRGPSSAVGLNSVYETEEPWRIKPNHPEDKLYKTKSIDIFEIHNKHGAGHLQIFEDFDDELKNTPVVKIEKLEESVVEVHATMNSDAHNNESFDHDDSSEDFDNADDDNSSRVTKILKQPEQPVSREVTPPKPKLKSQLYGNSRESLMGNLDEQAARTGTDNEEEANENFAEAESDVSEEDYDRPPSSAPSPPPRMSPPPPPLPQRQPSLRLSKLQKPPTPIHTPTEELPALPSSLPPLPQTKPPLPPNRPAGAPPKIPERTPSMSKVKKPLVKTASLRLAYSEQVNPQDVGKVNKLISRFEPNGRPRIIPRRPYISQESEDYSDQEEPEETDNEESAPEEKEDDVFEINANIETPNSRNLSRDITPTNTKPQLQKSFSIEADDLPLPKLPTTPPPPTTLIAQAVSNNNNNNNVERKSKKSNPAPRMPEITTSLASPSKSNAPALASLLPSISISSNQSDTNSNFSQPNSEYGSPMTYPSSLVGSTEVTPLSSRKETDLLNARRSRRSMTRDDERFYSFDSDEENSYYSISSTGSSRYIVEL